MLVLVSEFLYPMNTSEKLEKKDKGEIPIPKSIRPVTDTPKTVPKGAEDFLQRFFSRLPGIHPGPEKK